LALDFKPIFSYTFPMQKNLLPQLTFTVQVFREGKTLVAYNPELDISSCGDSADEAKKNLRDAVRGFLKSAHTHGTLVRILEEAGYVRKRDRWYDPEMVTLDRFSLTV